MVGTVRYLKMNGLGNEFVVLDGRKTPLKLDADQVRWISDGEQGIGCDQLIVMEKSGVAGVDVFMRIFNRDGTEVEACGNATRCIAALVAKETKRNDIVVQTNVGLLPTRVDGPRATVDMGKPKFDWQDIPLSEEFGDTRGIELQIGPIDAPVLHTPSVVNVGNPHAIFWIDEDPDNYDLERFGPLLENHPIFPERANISLAQILAPDRIKVRVWERGVGLTRACGTAACAVAAAGARKGLSDRKVQILMPGGTLDLEWRTKDDHILMSGPWKLEREGELAPELAGASAS
jgi:diaminopimelate epimerase